ncbi:AAA family ATPase [Nocardia sp. NPDC023852]|uniref:AAA family ATPase n=1 Tax=Nocardia sp. NPDC023852 TaxID=3154697 RepID=UPI0033F42D43
MATKPILTVISGPPGSGKTTLAHALADRMGCPTVVRDEIKQGMVLAAPEHPDEGYDTLNIPALNAFFDVLTVLARAKVSVVAEAAFQHKLWFPNLAPLIKVADIRVIHCTAPTALIHDRVTDRHRHAHNDSGLVTAIATSAQSPIESFDPINLDVPALSVDTSNGYRPDLDTITKFATQPHQSASTNG